MKVIFKFPYYDVDKNGTIEHEEFLKQLKNIDDWFGDNFVLMKQKFAYRFQWGRSSQACSKISKN